MENRHILIKKGLQKDVLYKGLKAKYIMYCLFLGLIAILLGLILSTFVPMVIALILIFGVIVVIFLVLLFYSRTYGANGFVKKMADIQKPDTIKVSNRIENLLLWKNK
jgi:ABC-type transport system involved in multi-copper enzyme maturation permease subunit